MNRKGLIAAATLMFATLLISVSAITLTLTYNGQRTATLAAQAASKDGQLIQTLLLNGKTASAVSAKKTASIAQEIEDLVIAYHAQSSASATAAVNAATAAKNQATKGAKELPVLLKQIEDNIASQDAQSIKIAVQDATTAVEQYFAGHPVMSVPAKGKS